MNEELRFEGCVHDGAIVEVGTNRHRERVVRIELACMRRTAPVTRVLIMSLDAAAELHTQLDGVLDDAQDTEAVETELVDPDDACPNCGQRDMDQLIWIENSAVANEVECAACGQVYALEYTKRPA